MRKILIAIVAVAVMGYLQFRDTHPVGKLPEPHSEVILYSLTTCGYCKLMAESLSGQGITFVERFIDVDPEGQSELERKLAAAGFEARGFGTPILDVKGTILPDNPPLAKVKKYL